MTTPIQAWTPAQRARRARKLARRRAAGHEPRAIDAGKLEVERARRARLKARQPKRSRAKLQERLGPEAGAAALRALGYAQGGAPAMKHRRRKIAAASRRRNRP